MRGYALWSKCEWFSDWKESVKVGRGFQQDCSMQLHFPWQPGLLLHLSQLPKTAISRVVIQGVTESCSSRQPWHHLAAWKKYKTLDFYTVSTDVRFFSPSIQCLKSNYCIVYLAIKPFEDLLVILHALSSLRYKWSCYIFRDLSSFEWSYCSTMGEKFAFLYHHLTFLSSYFHVIIVDIWLTRVRGFSLMTIILSLAK